MTQHVTTTTDTTSAIPGATVSSNLTKKRLYYGAQIVHQKEIMVTDHYSDDDAQKEDVQSESSYSLQPTPCARNLSERKPDGSSSKKPHGAVPFKMPANFLIRIDECKFHVSATLTVH